MNEEYRRGWISTGKILLAVLISAAWWLAGRGMDISRRTMLPALLIVGLMLWHTLQRKNKLQCFWYILAWPAWWAVMSLFSYGAGSWLRPLGVIAQRAIVALAWSAPAVIIAKVNKSWPVFIVHCISFVVIMVGLGAFSIVDASSEEAIIGLTWALLPQFMVKYE